MKWKISSKQTPLLVFLIGFVLFPVIFLDVVSHGSSVMIVDNVVPVSTQEEPIPTPQRPSYGLPVRLKIPAINVDSVIEYVGLTEDGAMDVPKERANTAWFNLGSRPGEKGNAVISGHYGWQNKTGSVFDNLYKLRKGDKIYIEDERGGTVAFVVRKSQRYDPKSDASAVFGSNDKKSHLDLITCEGVWDESTQSYSKRLVVFADKVEL